MTVLQDSVRRSALAIRARVEGLKPITPPPVEVLVRTYVPIRESDLDLPTAPLPYPVASGLWDVRYPFPDYPFKADVRGPDGGVTKIILARDSIDATLWRGTFVPNTPGEWTVSLTNTPILEPTRVRVLPEPGLVLSVLSALAAVVGAGLVGLLLGVGAASRRRAHDISRR